MKYYLSSFGLHNPFIKVDYADHLVYPVANEFEKGLDLDYGMLLVGDGFVMDADAYDFIITDTRGFLKPMAHSLRRLKEEGLLDFVDLKTLVQKNTKALLLKTATASNQMGFWLPAMRKQWQELVPERGQFVSRYGTPSREVINKNHFTLVNAVLQRHGTIDELEIAKMSKVVFSRRNKFEKGEHEFICEMIKPLVCHLLIHDLARSETGSTILDWDDSTTYYNNLYSMNWNKEERMRALPVQSSKLFALQVPNPSANNIDNVIRFIRDSKAVSSLRTQILTMIDQGEEVDAKWLLKYQKEIFTHQLSNEKRIKKIHLWGSIVGLFLPGGSLLTEIASEAGSSIAEESVERLTQGSDHRWYYAMQDNLLKKR